MSRKKFVLFAVMAMALATVISAVLFLAADMVLHARAEQSAGLNRWGYRGPVAPRKQPGEVRVAMLGGSTMFGYGVKWNEAIPALLEEELRRQSGPNFRTVNLGFNNEGAFASVPTLEDYAWLDYDIVALYHGYNDLLGDVAPNTAVYRHESPMFRLTGYFPILPLALQEKAMAIRTGGNIEAAYQAARAGEAPRVAFTPTRTERTSAAALEAISKVTMALGDQLDRLATNSAPAATVGETGAAPPWTHFCDSIYRAVKHARSRGVGVLVIAQPGSRDGTMWVKLRDQREQLQSMVSRHFGSDAGVVYVDMNGVVDPTDPAISFDGLHVGVDGNRMIARALVEPVTRLAENLGRPR